MQVNAGLVVCQRRWFLETGTSQGSAYIRSTGQHRFLIILCHNVRVYS